jgi:hypothetical protein
MAEKTATFVLNLDSNASAVSSKATAEVEELRKKIEQSQVFLKGMQGALRSLKGSSEEMANAKGQLKARIDAEKGALSQANLQLLKHGQLFQKVKQEVDKTKTAEEKLREGIKAAGGPVKDLTEKFDHLKGLLEGTHGKAALLALGFGTLVLGVSALAAGLLDAGFKLGKFIIGSANALRSMNLMREAATGSAENAKNLGTQVDFLSRKVSTSKEKINEIGVALVKSLSGGISKASGKAIVDTFAAVTEASAAMGDDVGNTLKGLIERGKMFNRVWMNPQELQGTGLQFKDVAGALAKNLGISVTKAKAALFEGRVTLEAGAAALRTAVETQFGKVNAEKLLDVDVQIEKLHEHLVGLSKNVVLEPLLKGMDRVLSKFDETTVTGQTLQGVFTKIGDAIVKFSVDHIDDVITGVEALVLASQKTVAILSDFSKSKSADVLLKGLSVSLGIMAGAAVALGAALAAPIALVGALAVGISKLDDAARSAQEALYRGIGGAVEWLKGLNFADIGKAMIDGLVQGITGGVRRVVDAVKGMVARVKSAFTGKDGIDAHSPSRFFEKGGQDSARGYAQGVDRGKPRAVEAVQTMARAGAGRGAASIAGSSPAGSGGLTVNLTLNFAPGMAHEKGEEIAKRVSAPSVLAQLARAVRQGMVSQGIPTQVPVT